MSVKQIEKTKDRLRVVFSHYGTMHAAEADRPGDAKHRPETCYAPHREAYDAAELAV